MKCYLPLLVTVTLLTNCKEKIVTVITPIWLVRESANLLHNMKTISYGISLIFKQETKSFITSFAKQIIKIANIINKTVFGSAGPDGRPEFSE